VALANKGWRRAMAEDRPLALGLNTVDGHLTNAPVAQAHGMDSIDLDQVLS
jgi:alanine dehydrogenase